MISSLLNQMNLPYTRWETIRAKDGIHVARVFSGDQTYVIKYFATPAYRREIENYRILHALGIQTLRVLAWTEEALLLEDIAASDTYRLATAADMDDPPICAALAAWYRAFHLHGRNYVAAHSACLYAETDCITRANIALIQHKTQTVGNPFWEIVERRLDDLLVMIDACEKTLNYNDFHPSNMIVAKDKTCAFMFDYNLMGKGYVAADIKNVTFGLGPAGKASFLSAYGSYPMDEACMHEVVGTVIALYHASCREVFPSWGKALLSSVTDGTLFSAAERLFLSAPER